MVSKIKFDFVFQFQFVFYFLVWSTVVSSGGSRSDAESGVGRTDLDLSQPQLGAALDNLFAPATITKQFVINFLGVRKTYYRHC